MPNVSNRNFIGVPPTRRQVLVGATCAAGVMMIGAGVVRADADEGISRTAESIHQEPVFKASRQRVFETLMDDKLFAKVVQLSGAMASGALGKTPNQISREEGGAFVIFGGYVTGRQIEIVPNERIVQVWRSASWQPGEYSIASFKLAEHGTGTKILLDHAGFPKGTAEHLAAGWKANYWEPLDKVLS